VCYSDYQEEDGDIYIYIYIQTTNTTSMKEDKGLEDINRLVEWNTLSLTVGYIKPYSHTKSKAVPLQAMVALRGRGGIAPTHS
jgi:hypothetical protein